jgi:hypothetical protein
LTVSELSEMFGALGYWRVVLAPFYIYIVHYLKHSFLDTLLFSLPRHEVSKYKAIEGGPWSFNKD